MSKKMNIDKAIEVCKELIAENSNDLLNCWDSGEEAKQAIEKVLGELKKKNYTENTLRYQIERLYKSRGEYEKARGVRLEHKTEYINKDKIKEFVKEHTRIYEMKTPNKNRVIYKNCILIDDLEELLKGSE